MKKRIGVYVCQCGSNISDYVDVEKVKDIAGKKHPLERWVSGVRLPLGLLRL